MDDQEFLLTGLKLAICPSESKWPQRETSFTRQGDQFIASNLHWDRAREAAAWLRERVASALAEIHNVDNDQHLSVEGRKAKKRALDAKAQKEIEQSKVVAAAKDSSERALTKMDKEIDDKLKLAVTPLTATIYNSLWNKCQTLEGARRLAWLHQNAGDATFVSAMLTAPTALTGLKKEELRSLRTWFEETSAPGATEERSATQMALGDLDRGGRVAISKICEAAHVKAEELINNAA
jgi:hypothetical protein